MRVSVDTIQLLATMGDLQAVQVVKLASAQEQITKRPPIISWNGKYFRSSPGSMFPAPIIGETPSDVELTLSRRKATTETGLAGITIPPPGVRND